MLRIVRARDESLEAFWGESPLFTYVYRPSAPRYESPKPYLHPVWTLAHDVVTAFRPNDHVWHKGVQMTAPHVSGQNFWGGGTYVHGRGYLDLPNNGTMEHMGWDAIEVDGTAARLAERLRWRTAEGEAWIDERRTLEVPRVDTAAGWYRLSFAFRLRNVAEHELVFSSPAIEGRAGAGYGGLFWRGPSSFVGGRILADGGVEGPEVMGKRARWLAFTGRLEGGRRAMLLFRDCEGNPRYPTEWFVRNEPFACVSFAFAFSEPLTLAVGDELELRHEIVVAADALDRARLGRLAAALEDR